MIPPILDTFWISEWVFTWISDLECSTLAEGDDGSDGGEIEDLEDNLVHKVEADLQRSQQGEERVGPQEERDNQEIDEV